MKKKVFIFLLLLISVGFGAWLYLSQKPIKIVSPVTTKKHTPTSSRQVIGFVPYWNLNKLTEAGFENLTKIYYFAVDLNPDGSFNQNDPGLSRLESEEFKKLKQLAKDYDLRFGVTIINLDQDSIAKNLNNSVRRGRIVKNCLDLMQTYGFTDLNLDLEYTGEFDSGLSAGFTALVSELRKEIPDGQLSIDMMADAAQKQRIINLNQIGKYVDYVVIMGYDFNRLSSIKAGPVAPLPGVLDAVTQYQKFIPSEKLVLGVPFYGYEWPTLDNQKNSWVIKSYRGPELSTYKRSLKTAADNNASINFDDESKSAWFSYYDKDNYSWRQVWFENERSLGLKLDLVNQLELSGVAIFALGYDGPDSTALWSVIESH